MRTLTQRRAKGQVGTAAFLAGLQRHVRPLADRIAPAPDTRRLDPITAAREIRTTISALRVLNAHRELDRCHQALRDEPDAADRDRLVGRVGEITAYLHRVEQGGLAPRLPYALLLEREQHLPDRRPRSLR
jgi:hypothetical protein